MRNTIWGFILILFGTLLLLDNLTVIDFWDIVGKLWPLLLILFGFSILRHRKREPTTSFDTLNQTSGADLVHQSSVFGDLAIAVSSQNFKGGSISTVFGDTTINLSAMRIAEGEHLFRLHSVFGDSDVRLPADAAVSITGSSILGSITALGQKRSGISADLDVASSAYATAPNRLKISVSNVFGDVRICQAQK
jgi:predicted membrane protein